MVPKTRHSYSVYRRFDQQDTWTTMAFAIGSLSIAKTYIKKNSSDGSYWQIKDKGSIVGCWTLKDGSYIPIKGVKNNG